MKAGRFVLLCVTIWAATSGCSSGEDGSATASACGAWCDEACMDLESCGSPPSASCGDDCRAGFGALSCKGLEPSYQFGCNELRFAQMCLTYCSTLCNAMPQCGPIDPGDCTTGCAERFRQVHSLPTDLSGLVCNPASVAARSCDLLGVEGRYYAGIGRGLREGSGTGPVGPIFPEDFGLCTNYCSVDSCSAQTSTCNGPCASDRECFGLGLPGICSAEGRCVRGQL